MNTVSYFEIHTTEPERAITFYSNIFEWKFEKEALLPIDYWQISTNGINGGLLKRPIQTPPNEYGTNAFMCSVIVENFDDTAAKILSNGGIIALPKFAIPGKCWQGYFIDTEGNTFGIFQVDEHAA